MKVAITPVITPAITRRRRHLVIMLGVIILLSVTWGPDLLGKTRAFFAMRGSFYRQPLPVYLLSPAAPVAHNHQTATLHQAGRQAIPFASSEQTSLVNSVFAAGVAPNLMQSTLFRLVGTLGEPALPDNVVTIQSGNFRHQPGFLAAAPMTTPTPSVTPTPTPTPSVTPTPTTPANAPKTWTMMLYLAGDTGRIDGGNIFNELKKAIRRLEAAPNEAVNVVALLDGPGDLDSFRVTFTPQARYAPLGEVPMDDAQTLVDFVKQARNEFPADYYYLVIADHANGVQGIAWDTTTDANKRALLTPAELDSAFRSITADGTDPIDVVHFDGCSFGLLENVAMVRNAADYLVISENIGWSLFAYDQYRAAITAGVTPRQLAEAVVRIYGQALEERPLPYTISALATTQLDAALTALNGFSANLERYVRQSANHQATVEGLRTASQKFDSTAPLLEITNDDWYVDLTDFAQHIQRQALDTPLTASAQTLVETLKTGSTPLVIAERHYSGSIDPGEGCVQSSRVWDLTQANGVSIYFPPKRNTTTFTRYVGGETFAYFTQKSHWDDFLQQGLQALVPGEPILEDFLIPLAPCDPGTNKGAQGVYLPVIRR
jgi:hypothetical protein